MRTIITLCLLTTSAAYAAPPPPASPSKPPPTSVAIRTAGDLADACTATPSPANAARINFCNGFAQGVLQTASQNPSGPKICLPNPSPKRSETMKEFALWAGADATRKSELASVGFLKFMSARFPCKEKI